MKTITRTDAKALGLIRYFTGQPCKRGHIAERQTSNTACIECHKANARAHYDDNVEKVLAQKKARYPTIRDDRITYNRDYYDRNRAAFSERNRTYYVQHSDQIAVSCKRRAKENPDAFAARDARKRARKLQATPHWLTDGDYAEIEAIYAYARRLTEQTGVVHHVDHIVPLKSKFVCGLHVPWNLRAIPAK